MARRSRDEWTKLVAASGQSGMSQAEFCRMEGISVGALGYWARKLREEAGQTGEGASIRFLPLAAAPARPPEEGLDALLPNGLQLRFPAGADASYVAAVLSALVV